jgi:hypothetical protein
MSFHESMARFAADRAHLLSKGIILPDEVIAYTEPEFKRDYRIAMDAAGTLSTTPNSGIPSVLTTLVDPTIIEIFFAPNKAAKIIGEMKKGTWIDDTILFPVVEHDGEVSSYGDFNENGHSGANMNWPNRQNYLFQVIKEYGEREAERAGLSKLNWVSEIDKAAALVMNKFANLTYFFGVAGLQNYGLVNDPLLPASLTPGAKAQNTPFWINQSTGAVTASANEVFTDIQSIFAGLVAQSGGLIEAEDSLVLSMSPSVSVALTATNSFNVNVYDLLKKNFPNIRFETAVQYGKLTSSNPQGIAGGNLVQMICENVEGQRSGFAAFSEKMRAHTIVKAMSSVKQKLSGGTWGTVNQQPFAYSSMLGV